MLAAWLVLAAAMVPLAGSIEDRLTVAARVPHSESAALDTVLATRYDTPFARWLVVVMTGVPEPTTDRGREVLQRATRLVDALPGVTRTFSYLDAPDTLFVGSGGQFLVAGLDPELVRPERILPSFRNATTQLERELRLTYPAATVRWTGEIALNADLRQASTVAAERGEQRALPLTLAVLVVAFGALAAALLPLAGAAVAVVVTLGIAAVIASWWPLSIVLQSVVSMLGLGLGIDYALLATSRFRRARAAGCSVHHAAALSVARTAPTVLLSAGTVAIGFGALLLLPLDEIRAIAAGGLVVAGVSALVAVTLVPAALAAFGGRLDAGRMFRRHGAGQRRLWGTWARTAVRHPWTVLILGALPVVALASQALRLDTRLPRGDWLPRDMESARAVRDLQAMERGNIVQTIRIHLEMPQGVSAFSHAGWAATSRVAAAVLREPEIARVRALPTVVPGAIPGPLLETLLPGEVRATFASRDGRSTLLELVPTNDASPNELADVVTRLRERGAFALSRTAGARMLVGGIPAFNADYRAALTGRLPTVACVVVIATLLVLGVALRSVLIPIKAVALNLLTVGAAFGAMVVVFGDGFGIEILGLDAAPGGTFPMIPVLVFCVVFGLSMDYELFLITRVAEARRKGASESDAIVAGIGETGGVITSAAAIMIAVFGAFMLGDVLLIQMLGFALAVAVFVDATVVRMAIGPALLRLAGRWNWWPGALSSRGARSRPRRAHHRELGEPHPLPVREVGASP